MTLKREADAEICLVGCLQLRVHLARPERGVDVLEEYDGVLWRVREPVLEAVVGHAAVRQVEHADRVLQLPGQREDERRLTAAWGQDEKSLSP